MARHMKKGDSVTVLWGKDKGKNGKILRVLPSAGSALVERINLVKHFERKSQQNPAGGIVEREAALPLGKLAPLCPKCNRGVRIGWVIAADGSRQRICKRCKGAL